jgi:glycine/D-amino acid oxidase-like deaminating enzyme
MAQIAIVGAGIVGLVSAFQAQRAGHAVTLFEQTAPGAGASSKSLGLLVPSNMKRKVDEQQRLGISLWPALAAELETATGTPRANFWRAWPDAEHPGRQQVHLPYVFQVLLQGFQSLGGTFQVETCTPQRLAQLAQQNDFVLCAAGFHNSQLGLANMKVMVGQAMRIKPAQPINNLFVGDNVYICPDWDDTALIGSVSWDAEAPGDGQPTAEATQELWDKAITQRPDLVTGAQIVETWVGYRPLSAPRMPLLQSVEADGYSNVAFVPGLGKIGVGISPAVAQALLERLAIAL